MGKNRFCSQVESVQSIQLLLLQVPTPVSDVDHGVIKCLVPGNESHFQKYINERHVSVLLLMLWYICSECAKIVPFGGCRCDA
jgi:hypothetical protein